MINQHPQSHFSPHHFILVNLHANSICNLDRNYKKVGHGGGTSYRAERIRQSRAQRGERQQLRAAAAVFCPLLL